MHSQDADDMHYALLSEFDVGMPTGHVGLECGNMVLMVMAMADWIH